MSRLQKWLLGVLVVLLGVVAGVDAIILAGHHLTAPWPPASTLASTTTQTPVTTLARPRPAPAGVVGEAGDVPRGDGTAPALHSTSTSTTVRERPAPTTTTTPTTTSSTTSSTTTTTTLPPSTPETSLPPATTGGA